MLADVSLTCWGSDPKRNLCKHPWVAVEFEDVSARATGKHGNVGMEMGTGMETTKRCGEREPVSWPYSRQESQMSLN